MAELEKKYSDYQENECKEEQKIEVIDEKLCPTCQPNPDFKLEDFWWEIKRAYLNEKTCEYQVRIYEVQAKREMENTVVGDRVGKTVEDFAIDLAVLKILNEFNKPINDATKQEVSLRCSIIDTVDDASPSLQLK